MEIAVLRTMLAWLMQAEGAGAGDSTMSHCSMRSMSALSLRAETAVSHDIDGSNLLRPSEALSRRASGGPLTHRLRVAVEKQESGVFLLTLVPSISPDPRHL